MNNGDMHTGFNPRTGRILIVDDEEIVHQTLKRILRDEGYTIDSAYGGEEALSMLENNYDLIICDIRMPDIDGIEVLRQIKKRELPVEVIMLTGYATLETSNEALSYGARSHILKPIENIPEFISKVSEGVDVAQLARNNKLFYNSIVSGQTDSVMIDGRPSLTYTISKENIDIIRRLLEAIHDCIVALDVDGCITFANVNFAQIIGESYQNLLGKRFESYVVEDEKKKVLDCFSRVSSGQTVKDYVHLKTCFGRLVSIIISYAPIYYEMEYKGVALVISNITEMKRAREDVKLLAHLVETAQFDMIFILKPDGNIVQCNALARNTFGYTQSEMLSKNIRSLSKSEANWKKIIDYVEHKSHWRGEFLAISRDGRELPVEMTISKSFIKNDKSICMICFMRDITDRKKAEESLKKALNELEATQIQLLQAGKLAAMGQMAAGVAHELSQPLFGIKGFAEAMLEDLKHKSLTIHEDVDMKKAASDLEVILQQIDRMNTIINAVRTFAHESRTEKKLLSINKPIEDALMLFSEQLRVHNIELEKKLASGLPEVIGNANQLQQVFINLITNARDAMDAKGGKGKLTITTGVENSYVYIKVEDTGIGADKKTVSCMFTPFFTTKRAGEGVGLGLPIVKRIIEDHKGKVMVDCVPGESCRFTVLLPYSTGG